MQIASCLWNIVMTYANCSVSMDRCHGICKLLRVCFAANVAICTCHDLVIDNVAICTCQDLVIDNVAICTCHDLEDRKCRNFLKEAQVIGWYKQVGKRF